MAKTLTDAIRRTFSADVRRRGEGYFARGAVRVEQINTTSIQARVQGTRRYTTILDWSGPEITASCDCPYFVDSDFCKHLWAVALVYDQKGPAPAALAGKKIVEAGEEFDEGIDDDYQDDDEDKPFDEEDGPTGDDYDQRNAGGFTDSRGRGNTGRSIPLPTNRPKPQPSWQRLLAGLHNRADRLPDHRSDVLPPDSQLRYVIDVAKTLEGSGLVVNTLVRKRKKDGQWSVSRPTPLTRPMIEQLPDPADRQIAAMLLGANKQQYSYVYDYERASTFRIAGVLSETLLPLLCASGRCHLATESGQEYPPLGFDGGPAWHFRMAARADAAAKEFVLSGCLQREAEAEDLASPVLLSKGGWVFWPDRVARLEDHDAFEWIVLLRREKQIRVPVGQADRFLEALLQTPILPPIDLPPELSYESVRVPPQPTLRIRKAERMWGRDMLHAELGFEYEGRRVDPASPGSGVYVKKVRRLILRDRQAEAAAAEKLGVLGLRRDTYRNDGLLTLNPKHLPRVVATLVAEGWNVQADKMLYRRAGAFELAVSSGIDWFELHGQVDFGGVTASLPQLLAALNKGESFVRLDDGSLGVLPEEWLRKFGLLASVATTREDHLRFNPTQAGFLDALLAAQPEVKFDEAFSRARQQLREFERIEPADAPAGFSGTLRPYQRDGLGWLSFLQRFGFGGCLADDMGLGKTVQVLAMLENRRQLRANGNGDRPGPSLAVVPRSLVFNWREEAARFAPALRVLEHVGVGRAKGDDRLPVHFDDYDLVLTTYGTLRRDVAQLKNVAFDYLIFDESQAIKNAGTVAAKAARLLGGRHRLCLSGTPIENHLGELWSQFEVLNPGLLGTSPALAGGTSGGSGLDEATRQMLARALRPFILRRTKAQVAADLPEKTEQTIYCELEAAQRKLYDELRDHYRGALLARVGREGMNKSKIQILEALLRLRQAAIHPGLIDKTRAPESSAKLEALLAQIQEVLAEGHKALVFSQFTTMLAIVRDRLDQAGIVYEYLDGRTRDRQARVDRFQSDPQCGLFLISLKAGGLGLNLTAAEYVFLLDPWWNPAVEAQAIDRVHRIGQTRQVFAYRLIARDTVEERIVELQQSKRALAEAVITADNSLIRSLTREDLELLLG
jgi:superfamily II DNA or RNA helicase